MNFLKMEHALIAMTSFSPWNEYPSCIYYEMNNARGKLYPPDGLSGSNSRNTHIQQKWGHAYLYSLDNPKAAET